MWSPRCRPAVAVLVVVLGAVIVAPAAMAQDECYLPITGPSQVCEGTVELCGPEGYYAYDWTGPNNFHSELRCITVGAAGTYTLHAFDNLNNMWFGPCTHDLTNGSGGVTGPIEGPATGCTGTAARLCGPNAAEFTWTGPNGFVAATQCVDVTETGSYTLRVRQIAGGCWDAPAEHALSFDSCEPPQPPNNCPRPPWFWKRACWSRTPGVEPSQLAEIAACVDANSTALAWSNSSVGFCATMANCSNLGARARRQFATMWANVCAGELGVTQRNAMPIGLGPSTPISLQGVSTTVGEWLTATDAELVALASQWQYSHAVKQAYRRIIRVGWSVNHGLGVGPTCTDGSEGRLASSLMMDGQDDMLEDTPLEQELSEEVESGLRFDRVGPNPAAGRVDVTFSVAPGSSDDVSVGVYDIAGRLLRELARGPLQPGSYQVSWDGRGSDGIAAPNGVYFVMGRIGSTRVQGRLTLVR